MIRLSVGLMITVVFYCLSLGGMALGKFTLLSDFRFFALDISDCSSLYQFG
jgi:hypothetical protein